jgi:alpha-glucosidase
LYPEINVAKQEREPKSVLSFWKQMLRLRKDYRDLFIHGNFEVFDAEDEKMFMYAKEFGGQKALTVLNFTGEKQPLKKPDVKGKWQLLVGNFEEREEEALKPYEGRIYLLS